MTGISIPTVRLGQWGYAVVTTNKETSFSLPIAANELFGGWVTRNASVADNIASIRSLRSSEIILITNQVSSQTSCHPLREGVD